MRAFLEVYDSSFDALYRYVLSRIGNHDDADDIVSDAFLRVFRRYQDVTDGEQLRKLLFVTARNIVIDRSRHIRTIALPTDYPSAEGQDAVAETVQDALATLEPDERDLIALKYFSRLTFREMSEIMGISERTVQSRIRTVCRRCALRSRRRNIMNEHQLYDFGDDLPVNTALKVQLRERLTVPHKRIRWWALAPAAGAVTALLVLLNIVVTSRAPALEASDLDIVGQTTIQQVANGPVAYVGETEQGPVFLVPATGIELYGTDSKAVVLASSKQLTAGSSSAETIHNACLSPNGDMVAYELDQNIYTLDLPSGKRRLILKSSTDVGWDQPAFVGSEMLVATRVKSSVDNQKLVIDTFGGIVLVDLNDGMQTVLAEKGGLPSATRDGKTIVFTQPDVAQPVVRFTPEGSVTHRYGQQGDHSAVISPDGRYIVFLTKIQEFAVTDARSFSTRRILLEKGTFYDLRWSRDSRSVYLLKFASIEGWSATYLEKLELGKTDVSSAQDAVRKYLEALILHQDDIMRTVWKQVPFQGPLNGPGAQPVGYTIGTVRQEDGKTLVSAQTTYAYAMNPWEIIQDSIFTVIRQNGRYLIETVSDGPRLFMTLTGRDNQITVEQPDKYGHKTIQTLFDLNGSFNEELQQETGLRLTGWGASQKAGDGVARQVGATPLEANGLHLTALDYDPNAGWVVFALQRANGDYRLYAARVQQDAAATPKARLIGKGYGAFVQSLILNNEGQVLVNLDTAPQKGTVLHQIMVCDVDQRKYVPSTALADFMTKGNWHVTTAFWRGDMLAVVVTRSTSKTTIDSHVVEVYPTTGALAPTP